MKPIKKILLFTLVCSVFSYTAKAEDGDKTDSTRAANYKLLNKLKENKTVLQYFTIANLEKDFNSNPSELHKIDRYFTSSYELIPIESYTGLRITPESFNILDFEIKRKKTERVTLDNAVQGYKLILFSDNELKGIITPGLKEKAKKRTKNINQKK